MLKKLFNLIVVIFVVNALIFTSTAYCGGIPDTSSSAPRFTHIYGTHDHHGQHHWASAGTASTSPFNVTIVDGTGHIKQFGNVTVIWISSPDAVLEGNISTNLGDIVKIFMKAAGDTTVLESTNGFASLINGHYYSNATLMMLNTAGFVFGASAQVKAANEIVSTLNISNADLLAGLKSGKYKFTGQGTYIINDGKLIAQPGGYISLLSGAISNNGRIQAKLGKIVLASGDGMTLTTVDLDDSSTIFVAIDKAVENEIDGPNGDKVNTAIINNGTISANGGTITLTAKTLNTIFDHSINNTGIIEAKSLSTTATGDVVLKTNGDVENSGVIKSGNMTIAAKKGIASTGSLIASAYLKLLSEGPISSLGTLSSSSLLERGASFQVGGIFDPGVANVENADNAMTYASNADVSGTIEDAVNIIIDPNVVLTMTGDTSFKADTGSFLMDPSATINGGGYKLTITAANDVGLGKINNVSSLTATATTGNLVAAGALSTNGGNINLTAGQNIVQENAINTNGGNYTATAGKAYDLDYVLSSAPSISAGNGIVDLYAPTVAEVGPGWGFSGNTSNSYAWEYLSGLRGSSLLEFGFYFLLGNTIVHVPSVSVDPSGNITTSVSGIQNFININVNNTPGQATNAAGGTYIVFGWQGAVYAYWYSNPALNADGDNHVILDSLSNEAAQLASTASVSSDGYDTVMAWIPGLISLATANPNGGTLYNWKDVSGLGDKDYNDAVFQVNQVTGNALIITANNQTTTYGTLPSLTVSYSGGSAADLTTLPTVSTTATATSNVGTYGITVSGAVDPTASILYVPGILTINPAPLTITAGNQTLTYGNSNLDPTNYSVTGLQNGETIESVALGTNANLSTSHNYDAGTWAIDPSNATGGSFNPSNYTISYKPGVLTVNPATLTIGGLTAPAKTYDGTTTATINGTPTLNGVVTGDIVDPTGTPVGTYNSADVATATTVTVTNIGINGADAGNYVLTTPTTIASTIIPAGLTITAGNQTLTYGNSNLDPTNYSVTGLQNGETIESVALGTNANLSTSHNYDAGTWAIDPSNATGGSFNPSNYTISYKPGVLTVNPATLTIGGLTAPAKTYDGTTTATINGTPTLNGVVTGDIVDPTGTPVGTYNSADVATATTVTVTNIGINGADAGNYVLTTPTTIASTIIPAGLTITAGNQTLTYGNSNLDPTNYSVTGLQNGETIESVALGTNANLSTSHNYDAGTWAIDPSNATGGSFNPSNYTISYKPGVLTVNPATLTIGGLTAPAKTYDGTTTATINGTPTLNGVVTGDIVDPTGTPVGTYNSADVATATTVTVTNIGINGADAGNYVLTTPTTIASTIIPAGLTITAGNQTLTYGNSNLDPTNYSVTGLQNGETIESVALGTNANLSTSHNYDAGTWAIDPSNATGGSFNPSNYTISYKPGVLTVNPATLTIGGLTAPAKTYDGTTTATINGTPTLNGVVTGDIVDPTGTPVGTYNSADVATATTVTVTNIGINGADAGNYVLTTPTTIASTIIPAGLTITAGNQTLTYGNSNLDPTNYSVTGLQNGETIESVALGTNANLSTSHNYDAGTWAIDPSNATGGSFNPSNYTISYKPGVLTVNPATLTIGGLTAPAKTYDGTTTATINGTPTLNGVVTGDVVDPTGTPVGTYNSADVATATTVTVTGIGKSGADASNYVLAPLTLPSSINPAGNPNPNPNPNPQPIPVPTDNLLLTNNKVYTIIYETLHPYQLSNSIQEPLVYFYHPITSVDQSAFNGIALDEGAYDFIENSLELKKLPASYYGM